MKYDWILPKSKEDALHYVFVFSVLALVWVPIMTFFQNNLMATLLIVFLIFYVTDKVAHRGLKLR